MSKPKLPEMRNMYLLLSVVEKEKVTASGIHIPSGIDDGSQVVEATVVAVDEAWHDEYPLGCTVFFPKVSFGNNGPRQTAVELKIDGIKYTAIDVSDVICVELS